MVGREGVEVEVLMRDVARREKVLGFEGDEEDRDGKGRIQIRSRSRLCCHKESWGGGVLSEELTGGIGGQRGRRTRSRSSSIRRRMSLLEKFVKPLDDDEVEDLDASFNSLVEDPFSSYEAKLFIGERPTELSSCEGSLPLFR